MDTQSIESNAAEEVEEPTEVPTPDVSGRDIGRRGSQDVDRNEQMAINRKATGSFCAESGMVPTAESVLSARLHIGATWEPLARR